MHSLMPTTRHLTDAGVSCLCQWRAIPARAEPDARAPAFAACKNSLCMRKAGPRKYAPFPSSGTGPAIRLNIPAGPRTLRKGRRSASRSERFSPGLGGPPLDGSENPGADVSAFRRTLRLLRQNALPQRGKSQIRKRGAAYAVPLFYQARRAKARRSVF